MNVQTKLVRALLYGDDLPMPLSFAFLLPLVAFHARLALLWLDAISRQTSHQDE